MAQAPSAPWSPFPLTELVVLLSLALIVAGVLTDGGRRGALLGCGFALVSLAGLELAVREHFAGYRSHSTLLAAACAIVVDVPLFLWTGLPQVALLVDRRGRHVRSCSRGCARPSARDRAGWGSAHDRAARAPSPGACACSACTTSP